MSMSKKTWLDPDTDEDDDESSTRSFEADDLSSVEDEPLEILDIPQDSPLRDFTLPCWADLDKVDLTQEFSLQCLIIKQVPADVSPCLKRFAEQLFWAIQDSPEGSQARERAWKVMQLRDRWLLGAPLEGGMTPKNVDVSRVIRDRMAALASGQWQQLLQDSRQCQGLKRVNSASKINRIPKSRSQETLDNFASRAKARFSTSCSTRNITSQSVSSLVQSPLSIEQWVYTSCMDAGGKQSLQCTWRLANQGTLTLMLLLAMVSLWYWCGPKRPHDFEAPFATWDATGPNECLELKTGTNEAWPYEEQSEAHEAAQLTTDTNEASSKPEEQSKAHEAAPLTTDTNEANSKPEVIDQLKLSKARMDNRVNLAMVQLRQEVDERLQNLTALISHKPNDNMLALQDLSEVDSRLQQLERVLQGTDQTFAQQFTQREVERQAESARSRGTTWFLISFVMVLAAVWEAPQNLLCWLRQQRALMPGTSQETEYNMLQASSESTAVAEREVHNNCASSHAFVSETHRLPKEALQEEESEVVVGPLTPSSSPQHNGNSLQSASLSTSSSTNQVKLRVTAASAAVGAVATGTAGGIGGGVIGSAAGAAIGVVPAFFTFGLSIPVFAAIGGSIGGCAGTVVGGSVGAVGGGAAGYGACTCTARLSSLFGSEVQQASPSSSRIGTGEIREKK